MKLSKLKINPNNPQKFEDLAKLKRSLTEFPKMMELRPLVFDPLTGFVLGGNKRLICLQELGYKDIPDNWAVSAEGLSESEKKRFILADNIGFGEWDKKILELEFSEFDLDELGLELDEGGVDYEKSFDGDMDELLGADRKTSNEESSGDKIKTQTTCPKCGFKWER
jgi:ParB-like chromosome segregation protein Spo0J